jgi:hypothetical protein
MSQVRSRQLALVRERAKLKALELELSHSLTDAYQNLDGYYQIMQTALLQWFAARQQVDALQALLVHGQITLDLLLDAQRRLAESEVATYQSMIQYNMAIVEVHYRKGSLMDYCGVMMAEGPWPAKAYWDAEIQARRRDASYYFNYGYTRPSVVSRGSIGNELQAADDISMASETPQEPRSASPSEGTPAAVPEPTPAEPASAIIETGGDVPVGSQVQTPSPTEKFDWGSLGLD